MRLIDADALYGEINGLGIYCAGKSLFPQEVKGTILQTIDEQSTVDAVPVVRCVECKYFDPSNQECYRPNYTETGSCYAEPDGGCSYGKREDGESL